MRNLLRACLLAVMISSCSHQAGTVQAVINWQNLDLEKDGVFGISIEKAYTQLLQHKKPTTTIVAIIDSGIDTTQEDLSAVLWTNPVDGSHGRNYILQETGTEDFIPMLAGTTNITGYHRTLEDFNLHVQRLNTFMEQLKASKRILEQILNNIGNEKPSSEDFKQYQPRNEDEIRIRHLVMGCLPGYQDFKKLQFCELDHLLDMGRYHLEHGLNRKRAIEDTTGFTCATAFNTDISNDALGLIADSNVVPEHGTHMAGIIAAVRNNGKGINGITDHAQIMMLKLFNSIREMRDEYLAPAIRFATDHGARVISMSFGKTFSLHKAEVDKAVQYAMSKDVLIVHSSGNNAMDTDADSNSFYPSPKYRDGGVAPAWITVGASGFRDDSTLVPSFSNYGKNSVDVFAPGVQITSTIPHAGLACWDGTSQATPVVAGLAALVRSYYPRLSAIQVKEIIMKTVVKRTWLKDKCVSGGIVNAYNALKLAADYK